MVLLRPDAWQSMRSRMPPHVAARHAALRASRNPAITAMASSPASAAHGASARAGWIGRGDGTGGFKFSNEAARPPRLPRRASCVTHPSTPQNPARGKSELRREPTETAPGETSKPAAWPKTSATATRPRASFGSNLPRRHSAVGVHRVTRATARGARRRGEALEEAPSPSFSPSRIGRRRRSSSRAKLTSMARTAHSCMRRR
mmetsp:Transcript_12886/g.54028  ORF Transcript_12886/g.54028 Transcript_12886/m.54028 type:complete len:203 (+) Transcript_12886:3935-4543(+)